MSEKKRGRPRMKIEVTAETRLTGMRGPTKAIVKAKILMRCTPLARQCLINEWERNAQKNTPTGRKG
jgi:hypothetical protein